MRGIIEDIVRVTGRLFDEKFSSLFDVVGRTLYGRLRVSGRTFASSCRTIAARRIKLIILVKIASPTTPVASPFCRTSISYASL